MCEFDALLLGDDGGRHGRSEVVDHDDHVGGMLLEEMLEFPHDSPCQFVEADAVDPEEHVGSPHL